MTSHWAFPLAWVTGLAKANMSAVPGLALPPPMSPQPNEAKAKQRQKPIHEPLLRLRLHHIALLWHGKPTGIRYRYQGKKWVPPPRSKTTALAPKRKKSFSERLSCSAVSNATAKPFKRHVRNLISDIGFEGFARRFCFEARSQPQSCPVTLSVVGGWSGASCARPVADSAASGPCRVPSGRRPRSPQSEGASGWLPLPAIRCLRRKAQLVAFAAVVCVDRFLLPSNWPRAIRRPRQEYFPGHPRQLVPPFDRLGASSLAAIGP